MDGLAGTFDRDAAGYAAGRPGYPPALFDVLGERCGLRPGARVVEVGPGTGQATAELLRRGAVVTAVEPGRNLAAHLVETLGGQPLTVVTDTFERARLEAGSADLVASATAFHWVDPEVGPEKVRTLLRPGGWVALWWNVFHDPEDEADAFSDAVDPIFSAFQDAEGSHATRGGASMPTSGSDGCATPASSSRRSTVCRGRPSTRATTSSASTRPTPTFARCRRPTAHDSSTRYARSWTTRSEVVSPGAT